MLGLLYECHEYWSGLGYRLCVGVYKDWTTQTFGLGVCCAVSMLAGYLCLCHGYDYRTTGKQADVNLMGVSLR